MGKSLPQHPIYTLLLCPPPPQVLRALQARLPRPLNTYFDLVVSVKGVQSLYLPQLWEDH